MTADYCKGHIAQFDTAVQLITNLPRNGSFQPSNELKLRFYAYFKQATRGPCLEDKPAFWDPVKRAKWQAWKTLGSMPKQEAMVNYVDTLRRVVETMEYSQDVHVFLRQLNCAFEGDSTAEQSSTDESNGRVDVKKVNGQCAKVEKEIEDSFFNYSSGRYEVHSREKPMVNNSIVKQSLVLQKSNSNSLRPCLSEDDLYADACDVQAISDERTPSPSSVTHKSDAFVDGTSLNHWPYRCHTGDDGDATLNHTKPPHRDDHRMDDVAFDLRDDVTSTRNHSPALSDYCGEDGAGVAPIPRPPDNVALSSPCSRAHGAAAVISDRFNDTLSSECKEDGAVVVVADRYEITSADDVNDHVSLPCAKDGARVASIDRLTDRCNDKGIQCYSKGIAADADGGRRPQESAGTVAGRTTAASYARMLSHVSDESWRDVPATSSSFGKILNLFYTVAPSHFLRILDRFFKPFNKIAAGSCNKDGFNAVGAVDVDFFYAWRRAEVDQPRRHGGRGGGQKTLSKLSRTERHALRRWRPRANDNTVVPKNPRGDRSDGDGNSRQKGAAVAADNDVDGSAGRQRSGGQGPTTTHALTLAPNAPGTSQVKMSSSSDSTSHDDSTVSSSSEWNPHVGAVLLRMHGELRRLGRQMDLMQGGLIAQQQLIRNSVDADKGRCCVHKIPWKSVMFITLWPIIINLIIRYAWHKFTKRRL